MKVDNQSWKGKPNPKIKTVDCVNKTQVIYLLNSLLIIVFILRFIVLEVSPANICSLDHLCVYSLVCYFYT